MKKNSEAQYTIYTEQLNQKMNIKYTVFDLTYLILAGFIYFYFNSIESAGGILVMFTIIYHKYFINFKRYEYDRVFVLQKVIKILKSSRYAYKKNNNIISN